jgi:hypothetical protein
MVAKHGIQGKFDRLTKKIIPEAQEATREAVEAFQEKQRAKAAGKTTSRIAAYLEEHGAAAPAQISRALGISRHTIVVACRRMTAGGSLISMDGLYIPCILSNKEPKQQRIHSENVTTIHNCRTLDYVAIVSDSQPAASPHATEIRQPLQAAA